MEQKKIDYKRLVLLLLPTFMRRPRIFAFLCSLTYGASGLYERFLENKKDNLLRIRRNGQVCHLRGMLNDELDFEQRRIQIADAKPEGDWLTAFDQQEAYQLFIPGVFEMIYSEALILENTAFFNVTVPWGEEQADQNNRLCSYLNEYKLLSKKYEIKHGQTKL